MLRSAPNWQTCPCPRRILPCSRWTCRDHNAAGDFPSYQRQNTSRCQSASPRLPRHSQTGPGGPTLGEMRSEEHTSELQSLMRISYAVFCLKKKKQHDTTKSKNDTYMNRTQ